MSNVFRWLLQLTDGDVVTLPFADVAVAMIDPDDLGAVAAAALTRTGHDGKAYRLSGPEPLRPAEQVAIVAAVLGRDVRFEPQPDDEAREDMGRAMPEEYVDAFFNFFAEGAVDESEVLPTVEAIVARPPRSLADWAEVHAEALQRAATAEAGLSRI